jgi:hypothetical protein
MVDVAFRYAWMQKHPTPTHGGGDYHWHPDGVPVEIRSALTDLASRTGGQDAALWIASPTCAVWARTFSAVAPSDPRRYAGIAATIARPAGAGASEWAEALPGVFERMPLAPAAPPADARETVGAAPAFTTVDRDARAELFADADQRKSATRALLFGGQASAANPRDPRLPVLIGQMLSWLSPDVRAPSLSGAFVADPAAAARADSDTAANLRHYLGRVWFCPDAVARRDPAFAATAWRLVLELAAARAVSLASLFDELTRAAGAWDTTDNLSRYLIDAGVVSALDVVACDRRAPRPLCDPGVPDAGWLWNRLLNYWGRGFFNEADAALGARLGGLLALRVTADHLFHLDAPDQPELPRRYLRRLDYESLLTTARVATVRAQLQRLLPSLDTHA